MSTSQSPLGSGALKSRYVNGVLTFFRPSDGVTIYTIDPVTGAVTFASTTPMPTIVRNIRTRFTIAQINAGATLLAARAGFKYRMVGATAIAVGGAAGAVTTVDILGTQSSGVKLVAFAQASLTQSTLLRDGASGAAILADGASYVANDANTAITVGKTGSSVTTATHIDINFDYVEEAA